LVHKPFSNIAKIEKMVRKVVVFLEEETLNTDLEIFDGGLSKYDRKYGIWVKYVSTKSSDPREVFIYWDKVYEDIFVNNLILLIQTKKDFFQELNNHFLKSYAAIRTLTDAYYLKGDKFFKSQTNESLIDLFLQFCKVNLYALSAYYVPYYLVMALSRLVENEIQETVSYESEKCFEVFSTMGINTVVRKERFSFLEKLAIIQAGYKKSKIFNSGQINKLIFKQWYEFGACVYTHEEASIYKLSDYKKKFKRSLTLNVASELLSLKKQIKEEKKTVKKMLDYFGDKNIVSHIKWLRIMMSYRNNEAEYYDNYFDHCMFFFEAIAEKLEIAIEDLWLLGKNEIIDGLRGEVKVGGLISERKRKGFVIKQVGDKVIVKNGVTNADLYEKDVEEDVSSFVGDVASRGHVTGKVRIIFDPHTEAVNFQDGEILVTSMTTPDFVPLMKKAQAIITDEGGILCHAAIVSRELNTPCIVGTKISTRVLKDGDLVEVDAEDGLVKILKRFSANSNILNHLHAN